MPSSKAFRTLVENSSDEDDGPGDVPVGIDYVPEVHIYTGKDGHTRRDFSRIETIASPTKPVKPVLSLKPDLPPPAFELDLGASWAGGLGLEDDAPIFDLVGKQLDPDERGPTVKEGRDLRSSDDPLGEWVRKRKPQRYLDELVQLDGRGEYMDQDGCVVCGKRPGVYRCRDCFTDNLYCQSCMVAAHIDSPLHCPEIWQHGFFQRTTLKKLGLRIQLGHGKFGRGPRGGCLLPKPAVDDDFVIVDTHAIHEVGLDFCNCETAQPHDIQLIRARLYPATGKNPRTASTFRVLRRHHISTLESKCSCGEFYNSIARETDNTGTLPVRDRYDEFLRMTREWRHLQMLKRAGRGHAKSGIAGTKDGECALLCPACPQPGKNLPPDWKKAPKEKRQVPRVVLLRRADATCLRYLYALFLALDANFRMRRKMVSSEEKDPSLGDGWSFYGRIAPYYDYLARNWHHKQERSTCVAHDAVDKPDRESRGTASSGIATVDCARHNMKRPNSVGDLQLGERYINMDYIFFMGLAGSDVSELYVSYDIACQWHKNIWERMKTFPEEVRFVKGKQYCVFLIPKFHLPAHIEACNILFSFHLTRYVGMTDGEAPERGWSNLNPLATSTAEMGPGLRRDTINDAFNDWNHKKRIGLGKWLVQRMVDCVPEMIACSVELEELEQSLRDMGAGDVLMDWRDEVEAWEADSTCRNPFASRAVHKTVVDVRREMAEEVKKELEEDELEGFTITEDTHPTEMIAMGLQLEELQRSLAMDVAGVGKHPTAEQQTTMTERSNKLRRKLATWMDNQVIIVPHVAVLRAEEDRARRRISATQAQPGVQVQHMVLWLPSEIKGRVECDIELYEYEFRLREAQAHETLDEIRHQLLLRTHLYKYKDMYARGVKANTRCQTKIASVEERIRRSAERYRAARKALVGLGRELKKTSWEALLRPLAKEDVRGMPRALFQDPERKKQLMRKGAVARAKAAQASADAKATMSWIWRGPGVEAKEGAGGKKGEASKGDKASEGHKEPTGMNEALRIEWAKTRARFMRQEEQLNLLEEEMRRILAFLDWEADWWDSIASMRPAPPEDEADRVPGVAYAPTHAAYTEGNLAYSRRQAARLRKLRDVFETQWEDLADFISMARTALGQSEEDTEYLPPYTAVEEDNGPDEEPVPERQVARETAPPPFQRTL
ncbi:hypothetical protein C8R43DRAFT_1129633 [Mycena crocata]|nr:hypothetical protein C8R43DRAFT_1129633 [Mycena crocata]